MLTSPNTHRLSAVVGAWRRSSMGVSVQVDLRDRWLCSGCGWQRGKTTGLAAPSTRGVSTRSPMCKQDQAQRTFRLPSSFLVLTHKSPGVAQQAHRGLLTGPGPQVVQCYRAHQKLTQRMSQCYPLVIPISEQTINVITRLVLCSQSDDIYWQHFMGAKQRLFHKSHLPDVLLLCVLQYTLARHNEKIRLGRDSSNRGCYLYRGWRLKQAGQPCGRDRYWPRPNIP